MNASIHLVLLALVFSMLVFFSSPDAKASENGRDHSMVIQTFSMEDIRRLMASFGVSEKSMSISEAVTLSTGDSNTNQAFNPGTISLWEPIHYVYSSHGEPELVYNDGPSMGNSAVADAIRRGFRHIEESIQGIDRPDTRYTNLFKLTPTDKPLHPADASICHGFLIDNSYVAQDFSGDGVNSIVWHTWDVPTPEANVALAAITYTLWDENKAILESDIVFTRSPFMNWAIKEDLTRGGALDESPAIDIQAVATFMGLHVLGLRLVQDDGDPGNGNESDATVWQPPEAAWGRAVIANIPGAHHPHGWQTLTPGDIQGAYEMAPMKGDRIIDTTITPESDQLVFHFDFENIQGGVVQDLSGNGLDGVLGGGVSTVLDFSGDALEFDGTGYVDLDGPNFPRAKIPVDAFTVAAWVNIDKANVLPAGFAMLMEAGSLRWNVDAPFATTSHHFNLVPGAGTLISWLDGGPYALNHRSFVPVDFPDGWFHLAGTFGGNCMALYINAELEIESSRDTAPRCTGWSLIPMPLANSWDAGARIGNNSGSYSIAPPAGFVGRMDDFALFNYALAEDEVQEMMVSGPAAVAPSP
jgi:hypothetical protein